MTGWAIKHDRHGLMSALSAQVIITDPVLIREVDGKAILRTRATARTVIQSMERKGVSMTGYRAVPVAVRVEVVR